MTRITKHRLLLLAALVHLFGHVAFTDAAVLCVGANDHRAIEFGHLVGQSCETATSQSVRRVGANASSSEGCADSPLHPEEDLFSWPENPQGVPLLVAAVYAGFQQRPVLEALWIRVRAPDSAQGLRALRTTVLVI